MLLTIAIFALGYLAIVFEHPLRVNKSASALLTAVLCWTTFVLAGGTEVLARSLDHHVGDVAGILFFLLGAMTIVELIDAHDGFEIITERIAFASRRKLLVAISLIAFFLSAVLDNLTTSIVMMSLVRRLARDDDDRMMLGGVVIIAANAGGAWSPIGDVTTTMLWVGGQISSTKVIGRLFLPALVSVAVPVAWLFMKMHGDVRRPGAREDALLGWLREAEATLPKGEGRAHITLPRGAAAVGKNLKELNLRARTGASVVTIERAGQPPMRASARDSLSAEDGIELEGTQEEMSRALTLLVTDQAPKPTSGRERVVVLALGVGVLLFVPVFKSITHLPPFMGILFGLGVLWTVTEVIHKRKNDEDKSSLTVAGALRRVDSQSILFFLGILVAIGALQENGALPRLAAGMDAAIGNIEVITITIGLSSAIVDNVPLVAAAQGMYPLSTFPTDHHFWLFLAYCAGTGGSILIIGSAAGIAVMGMQRITFGWYVRKFSLPALGGYAAGAATYLAINAMLPP